MEVRMPGDPSRTAELESFVAEHGERLLRVAIFLGGSREAGEDLLQSALERLFRRWRHVRDAPERYVRQTLVHLATDGWRRRAVWRGKLGLLHASTPAFQPDDTDEVDRRDEIVGLLLQLPVRQRTAIVLRYLECLTEGETAHVMGCSVGTVKSTTSRALDRLRELSFAGTPQDIGSEGAS
jgi:RNA polymerase sigma-70 factor (sigma-E family)